MKEKTVSVAFRSQETGRYLFWAKWTKKEWAQIEEAANLNGVPIEKFILEAIKRYVYDKSKG